MKRSEALAPLSRDHHRALEVALRLRRASAESAGDAADRFLGFWDQDGRRHFEIEERLLLDALPAETPGWAELAARVRSEHADIRARADAVAGGTRDPAALHQLGQRLRDHVRFEERQLFGTLEDALAEDELARLAAAVSDAHG
jgi:hypothetical protein